MKELNMVEVDAVSGGFQSLLVEIARTIATSAAYDLVKGGAMWAWENSYGGRNQFPPVPRAGHE